MGRPLRGEIHPLLVPNIGLPDEHAMPKEAASLSPTVHQAFSDPERYMLRRNWAENTRGAPSSGRSM